MKRICVMIFILIILTGCSSKDIEYIDYIYSGGNENWYLELTIKGYQDFSKDKNGYIKYNSSVKKKFIARYKGDESDINKLKKISVKYESSAGSGSHVEQNPAGTEFGINSGGNGAIENKDENINVEIKLDNKKFKFVIKSND